MGHYITHRTSRRIFQRYPSLSAVQIRKAALLGHSSSKGNEQEELSDLGHMAIREGHVACLRVLTESCSGEVWLH